MKFDELAESTTLLKHFLDDTSSFCRGEFSKIDYSFYKKNRAKLDFYITKSFLNENFDELFEKSNLILPKYIFENNLGEARTLDANEKYQLCKIIGDEQDKKFNPSKFISSKDYCKMDTRFSSDPKLAYKLIRNSLSHFEYRIQDDRIFIEKEYYNENRMFNCEISVSSLATLVASTIGLPSFSCKKGAYDYIPFASATYPQNSFFVKIQNIDHNPFSPGHFHQIYASVPRTAINHNHIIKDIKYKLSLSPLKCNFYVKAVYPDKDVLKKAGLSKITNSSDASLYLCALDERIQSGGVYIMIHDLISDLACYSDKIDFSRYKALMPLINNTVFISFMTIVFDDYFIHNFNGKLNPDLFIEKTGVNITDIPRRLRNSLAHSRYRFDNIFDSSKGIIIEFWDEKNGEKNFECKISKENAQKLTSDYLGSILSFK